MLCRNASSYESLSDPPYLESAAKLTLTTMMRIIRREALKSRASSISRIRIRLPDTSATITTTHVRRFSALPRKGTWSSLPRSQRSAWEVLGWDREKWEGRQAPPPSWLSPWSELSPAEQAAATHGLGYTHGSWEDTHYESSSSSSSSSDEGSSIQHDDHHRVSERRVPSSIDKKGTVENKPAPKSARVTPTLFGSSKRGIAATGSTTTLRRNMVDLVKNIAKSVAPTLVDGMSDPVVVNDVETTLYLDDSPSMNESMSQGWFSPTRLEEAKKVVESLGPLLRPLPCRVLKFSGTASVLALREEGGNTPSLILREEGAGSSAISRSLALSGWDASGNGTYLWHMVQEDILKRYRPGKGKLRLVVVTDGEDNMSPSGYQGMRGMDPMMSKLQNAGYDIEWHIVVVGLQRGLERYKDLAGATGGSFLALSEPFDETSRGAKKFLKAVQSSGRIDNNDNERHERQRQYEIDTKKGKAERFDWYKALPPGGKKQ